MLACRQRVIKIGWIVFFPVPGRFLISSSVPFPGKCAESSQSLCVVIESLNNPGTTWRSNLEINRSRVWTHTPISVLWEGDEKQAGEGGTPSLLGLSQ